MYSKSSKAVTLCAAFHVYKEVEEKTQKAVKFYNQLFDLIAKLKASVQNMEEVSEWRADSAHLSPPPELQTRSCRRTRWTGRRRWRSGSGWTGRRARRPRPWPSSASAWAR